MSRKKPKSQPPANTTKQAARPGPGPALGGQGASGQRLRITQDNPLYGLVGGLYFLSPPDAESDWRFRSLDDRTLDRLAPADLIERLVDISPDISRALWDFLRLCNPGFEVNALRPGSEEIDTRAQAAVDSFLDTLKGLYGSVDVVINRLFISAFLRGGFFAELVLDNAGRVPIDLATPDPRWLRFRRDLDPQRGVVWHKFYFFQDQVSLEYPTIRYVPVDPLPGMPFGRPLASPALFTTLFVMGLLHDLRRVVSQQGYPRIDISVSMERLIQIMPADVASDPDEQQKWLASVVRDIGNAYQSLEPESAYIHPDLTTVNRPVGTVDSSSLGAIDGLMSMLERQACRSLKSNPLQFGLAEGVSEANANRQAEQGAAGIKSVQHLCESLLEYLLGLALRVQGIQATVQWRFAELRAAEMLRDAQTEHLQMVNAAIGYSWGWLSADEAAQRGAQKDKADVPEPRYPGAGLGKGGGGGGNEPMAVQTEPGGNRATVAEDILAAVAAAGNGRGVH